MCTSGFTSLMHYWYLPSTLAVQYGAPLSSRIIINNMDVSSSHECELWHRSQLKYLLGVCKSITNHVVMEELGRHPLCLSWLKQSLKFRNKIMKRDVDDLVHLGLIESANLSHGWVNDLNCALKNLGCTSRSCIGRPFDVCMCVCVYLVMWIFV